MDDEENIETASRLFTTLEEKNYKLGADKLWLGYLEVPFLGLLLRDGHIHPDPDKTRAIEELLPPKTKA